MQNFLLALVRKQFLTVISAYIANILFFQSVADRLPSSLVAVNETVAKEGFPWVFSGAPSHLDCIYFEVFISFWAQFPLLKLTWYNLQMYSRQIKPMCV